MEDNSIAKILISSIIEQEVLSLEFHPQESTLELPEQPLTIYRLDFNTRIKTPGGYKDVLIEIQKSQLPSDIIRFRKYLGEQYRKEALLPEAGGEAKSIPIITVYFLGHELKHYNCPVIQVARQCRDGITKALLTGEDEFIENPTHDCYIIHIPISIHIVDKDLIPFFTDPFSEFRITITPFNDMGYPVILPGCITSIFHPENGSLIMGERAVMMDQHPEYIRPAIILVNIGYP